MSDFESKKEQSVKIAIEIAIKLGGIALVLFVSFLIIKPFLSLILWSIILAVALFPTIESLSKKLNTTRKKVVIIFVVLFNIALIAPTYIASDKAIESMTKLSKIAKNTDITIPPPPKKIKEWPLVGDIAYKTWQSASKDTKQSLKAFEPQIKTIASKAIKILSGALSAVLISMVCVVIAGFLIIKAERYSDFYTRMSKRLIGKKGEDWAKLTALTIRSVANGVIGVAVIQAVFALVGLVLMNVPFSVVIAIVVMFLTIVQLPTILVIGPVIAFVLSQDTSIFAIIFTIYMLVVGSMDGILKPIFMGRGVDIPMLIVLIGAIGGMMLMGMIGLFVGAVIFALAYKLFMLWIEE